MNHEELKKLLKSVEICESGDLGDCNDCPFKYERFDGCGEEQHKLAKKLLQEMKVEQEKTTVRETKAIIFGDQTTRNVVLEWLHDGGSMLVGYKPTDTYKQWLVGHVVTIDLEKADITMLGISTGFISRHPLDRDARLIKWEGGPTADLICIDEVGGYLLGERYYIHDGQMSPCLDTRLIPAKDGRFGSLNDEFIKKHFVPYKGDVLDIREEKYLNGWLVCAKDHPLLTVGRRYRIDRGCFVDDKGLHHNYFTSSATDMETLKSIWHMIYVPDKK